MPRRVIAPALALVLAIVFATASGCRTADSGPVVVQPGRPGEASRAVNAADARRGHAAHTAADVAFMQGMIHHHAQALDMTALLYTRTTSDAMQLLARRIDVSQTDEIKFMQRWLEDRGAEAPGSHAHHLPGAPKMPGMLSAEEMERLAAATGAAFDRLFLEGMIKHHLGALTMVKDLFSNPGAGQEAEIFAFASDVEADQQMEIDRMRLMLSARFE
jgi:uncharacterized protein (DUF305 family)